MIPLLNSKLPDAFEDFISSFKTSPKKNTSALDGLENLNLDEDDFSDEYDFMDEDDEAQNSRRMQRKRDQMPKKKYMDLLQEVANREKSEITIDLDDLTTVSAEGERNVLRQLIIGSMRRASGNLAWVWIS